MLSVTQVAEISQWQMNASDVLLTHIQNFRFIECPVSSHSSRFKSSHFTQHNLPTNSS